MTDAMEAIRAYLVDVARRRDLTSYREVAAVVGLDLSTPADRAALAAALRDISTAEHAQGRPLLSVVVVLGGRRRPGQGFFDLAESLGFPARDRESEFFAEELARVHQHWALSPTRAP